VPIKFCCRSIDCRIGFGREREEEEGEIDSRSMEVSQPARPCHNLAASPALRPQTKSGQSWREKPALPGCVCRYGQDETSRREGWYPGSSRSDDDLKSKISIDMRGTCRRPPTPPSSSPRPPPHQHCMQSAVCSLQCGKDVQSWLNSRYQVWTGVWLAIPTQRLSPTRMQQELAGLSTYIQRCGVPTYITNLGGYM
jgi:hypothetical protein